MKRASLLLIGATLAVAPLGCTKKQAGPPVQVVDDDAGGQPDPGADDGGSGDILSAADAGVGPKRVHVRAGARELGDIMQLVKEVSARWTPESPVDLEANVQAMLLQMGYSPGLWPSVDWRGVMAVDARFELRRGESVEGLELFGSVAVKSAAGVIEALPSSQRPQPLGNGLWELTRDGVTVAFRERAGALDFALSEPQLDAARELTAAMGQGPRLQLSAEDFPPGIIDLVDLFEVPRSSEIAGRLAQISAELSRAELAADLGVDRDAIARLAIDGPFERLGLDPIGPPRAAPTTLERSLPADPVVVIAMPWGAPAMLHKTIDHRVPINQVPAPFDVLARDALTATHALLDQIANDVVAAVYAGRGGELTLVLAADVRDPQGARAQLRGLLDAGARGLKGMQELAGKGSKDALVYKWKPESVKAASAKLDALSITVPKDSGDDELAVLLTKKREFTVLAGVVDKTALLLVGPGASKFAGALGSVQKANLGGDAGLATARAASESCQLCVAFDPIAIGRLALQLERDDDRGKKAAQHRSAAIKALDKITLAADVGLGLRLGKGRAVAAIGLPKALLLPDPKNSDTLRAALREYELISEEAAIREPPPKGWDERGIKE